jgi:hypothetical protein
MLDNLLYLVLVVVLVLVIYRQTAPKHKMLN